MRALEEFADKYEDSEPMDQRLEDNIPVVGFEEAFDIDQAESDETSTAQIPTAQLKFKLPQVPQEFTHSQARTKTRSVIIDDSELIAHKQLHDLSMSKFKIAFGLFAHNTSMSRKEYESLKQILGLLNHPEIEKLPRSVTTLKSQVLRQLPLLDMRKKSIPLAPEKLATETATQKASSAEGTIPHEDIYFFDPQALFKAFLSSDIVKKMHVGMAEYRDEPTELWHSRCWASSLRTSSGQYPHYQHGSSAGQPIFPSDFVYFSCFDPDCQCNSGDEGHEILHFGRAIGFGKDFRTNQLVSKGKTVIHIQEVIITERLPKGVVFHPPPHPDEAFIQTSPELTHLVPEDHIHLPGKAVLDYSFGEDNLMSAIPMPQRSEDEFWVRRTIYDASVEPNTMVISPLCRSHPVRAELELKQFGREHFLHWDETTCLSVPLLTFIDGFGLYRNSYRSLMGFYEIPAAFSSQERARRTNVLPITLGPHGSNFKDVVAALKSLIPLDEGMELDITGDGTKTLVSVFTLCFIGDMPQQQENSGFKTQRATRGCRFCFIDENERGNMKYDISANGRYHHQALAMRAEMKSLRTLKMRSDYSTKWGISQSDPPLVDISPALDIILTRPSDPAHSEFQGITRLMHEMLLSSILSASAAKEYNAVLRRFPFPPGWGRLQSPTHHLKSYSISEHGRWSIIIPLLLRKWLREEHLHPYFARASRANHSDTSPVSYIVSCFATIAKSNSLLTAPRITKADRLNFKAIIAQSRHCYQSLCHDSSVSVMTNPRSRASVVAGSRAGSRRGSRSGTPAVPSRQQATLESTPLVAPIAPMNLVLMSKEATEGTRAVQFQNDSKKPNVHIGLHYEDTMEEYGVPANAIVLIGEDKHR